MEGFSLKVIVKQGDLSNPKLILFHFVRYQTDPSAKPPVIFNLNPVYSLFLAIGTENLFVDVKPLAISTRLIQISFAYSKIFWQLFVPTIVPYNLATRKKANVREYLHWITRTSSFLSNRLRSCFRRKKALLLYLIEKHSMSRTICYAIFSASKQTLFLPRHEKRKKKPKEGTEEERKAKVISREKEDFYLRKLDLRTLILMISSTTFS